LEYKPKNTKPKRSKIDKKDYKIKSMGTYYVYYKVDGILQAGVNLFLQSATEGNAIEKILENFGSYRGRNITIVSMVKV